MNSRGFLEVLFLVALLSTTALVGAEAVFVKYRGPVSLETFKCVVPDRSSFVERICFDAIESYLVVSLSGTYYHYCEVPSRIFNRWRDAPSVGVYYNREVKGRFDCRVKRMPNYN